MFLMYRDVMSQTYRILCNNNDLPQENYKFIDELNFKLLPSSNVTIPLNHSTSQLYQMAHPLSGILLPPFSHAYLYYVVLFALNVQYSDVVVIRYIGYNNGIVETHFIYSF